MKYKLNLDDDGRVLSVTYSKYGTDDMPEVDEFPKNVTEYRYVDGEFIHDPNPIEQPKIPVPTIGERVTELEEALALILSGGVER